MTPAAARATAKYRARFPERVAAATKKWQQENPVKRRTAERKWAMANPVRLLVRQAKARAKRKGIPFDIEVSDLLPLPEHCPVLGINLNYGPGRGRKLYENPGAASLDRIKNDMGYVKGNVIIVSLRANLLKGQATLAELQAIAAFYSIHAGRK